MEKQVSHEAAEDAAYYYSVRLLIRNTSMSVSEISAALDMEPDYSWEAGENNHKHTMWGHTSWTEGKRLFFDEVHDILEWLHERGEFVNRLLSNGGELLVIVQLPGTVNIGSELLPETMSLAAGLGVRLGIEVFPNVQRPTH